MLKWMRDDRTWQMVGREAEPPRSLGFNHSPHEVHLTEKPCAPGQSPSYSLCSLCLLPGLHPDLGSYSGNSAGFLSEEPRGWQRISHSPASAMSLTQTLLSAKIFKLPHCSFRETSSLAHAALATPSRLVPWVNRKDSARSEMLARGADSALLQSSPYRTV